MTFRSVCSVNNNQVIVTLPPNFKGKSQVTVVVNDFVDNKKEKLELLKKAMKDPLFLADIQEIQDDFDSVDRHDL
jgi:hypothetical protein